MAQPIIKPSIMKKLYLVVLLCSLFRLGMAQEKTIKGVVKDAKGPLIGVSIKKKGAPTGVSTDQNGNFTIQASPTDILVATYVGYKPREIAVADQTTLTINLESATQNLQEVVVVGYGTQSKQKVTGAIASVNGEELNKRVATNATNLLQGQLPGLQVTQNSAEPGNEGTSLLVRGVNTFSGSGNSPLVIVDGIQGNLSALNPNDIASVSVLKDAASAAIYGSRGANGVILVTTKKGKAGRFSLNYTYNGGLSKATALPDLITNSAEFMALNNEARTNSGLSPLYTQQQIDLYQNATDRNRYPNNNWLNDIFRTAYVQNHYVNMNGGKENTDYSVGLGYTTQPGIMKGFDYKKYTIQLNLNSQINKSISFGTSSLFRYGKRSNPPQGSEDLFLATLAQSPLYKPTLWDGSGRYTFRAYNGEQGNKNPVAIAEKVNTVTDDYYAQLNGYLNVKISDALRWENRGGFNFTFSKANDFRPLIPQYYYSDLTRASTDLDVGTLGLNINQGNSRFTSLYSQLVFDKQLGDHHIGALGGAQQDINQDQTLTAGRRQFPTNVIRELNGGPVDGSTNSGNTQQWAISSFYGRLNYDFKNKYILEASGRFDGSSRFPTGKRWSSFYAFSGGWRISQEEFLKDVSWLNELKLRGSWGTIGNQNINRGGSSTYNPYPYQNLLSSNTYPFGTNLTTGFYQADLVDPSLTWETTRVFDLGLDVAAFKNKLTFTADWFNKLTYDILRGLQIPLYIGLNQPVVNQGSMRNTGFELNAQYRDKITDDLTFTIGGNFQTFKNKLVKYGAREIGGNTIRQEGYPLDEFYLYQWDGIFQSQAEINSSATQLNSTQPGDLKFKDLNGDGKIDDKDRTYTPGRYPIANYTANGSLAYKGIDLSFQIFGSYGQKIYTSGWGIEPFRQGSPPTTDWRNRWTPQNPSNTVPRIYVADGYPPVQNYASTYFLRDASFVRLKNLQLGYTLPENWIKPVKMTSARLYFSADNVFTLSKYPGLDPERTNVSGNYVSYPQARIFTFGASVQF